VLAPQLVRLPVHCYRCSLKSLEPLADVSRFVLTHLQSSALSSESASLLLLPLAI
jgi:hypothetical protein